MSRREVEDCFQEAIEESIERGTGRTPLRTRRGRRRPACSIGDEHYDGSGYPDRLAGEEIPLAARIVCCCDAFNAMTTDRPYRAALSLEAASAELRRVAGMQFDPAVVDALLHVVSERELQRTSRLVSGSPLGTPQRGSIPSIPTSRTPDIATSSV